MGKLSRVLVLMALMCNVAVVMIMVLSQGGEAAELQGDRKLLGESAVEAADAKYYHGGGGGGYHGGGGGYHGGGDGGYHGGGGYHHGGDGGYHGGGGGGGYHHGGGGHP